jgi:predicted Zn-dependent protease with MMP-like domain
MGRSMGDIRFEKFIEALYEHMANALPSESRDECPLMKIMAEVLITVKEANNKEILDELGMLPCSNFTVIAGRFESSISR